jgi:hypothetical protein
MRGIPTKLWITAENSAALQIVASPLSTPTINTVGLANPGKGVDVDEVANLAVVYTSGAQYHTLDVSTNTLSAPIVFNLATGAGVDGAALDSRHSRILFALSDETFISPLGSNSIDITMTAQSLGATIDRTTGRAWAGGISSLLSFDLSTEAVLPTIPVSQAIHWMRFNPLAHLIVGVPNGMDLPGETSGYGVGLVDPEGGVLLGYLGTGKRGCAYRVGSSVMLEGVAIDQSRNRAFVTCSCDKSLQAYNLNILFVQ